MNTSPSIWTFLRDRIDDYECTIPNQDLVSALEFFFSLLRKKVLVQSSAKTENRT